MISLDDLRVGARFLSRLPGFLRRPLTLAEAREVLRRRLERREEAFLTLVKRAVYEHAPSPYRALLRHAGCEHGDLVRMVHQDGVENSLRALSRNGVYLTVEEFKGRRAVVRGSTTIPTTPGALRNPLVAADWWSRTSGSRGTGVDVGISLAFHRERAVNKLLFLDARGGLGWRHAIWLVPGNGTYQLLRFYVSGVGPLQWFSPIDLASSAVPAVHRSGVRALRWAGGLAGQIIPRPVHVPPEDPGRILRWVEAARRDGKTPHLYAFSSPALRLARAALAASVSLDGVQMTLSGEPLTAPRLAAIRQAGAEARPRYGTVEAGAIGYGCLSPIAADEVHVVRDCHALIQVGSDGPPSLPPEGLLLSSLLSTAPLVMLNMSLGDQAIVSERLCGCPLESLGWTTHLHTIRSFEKLTAAGMTFLDADVIRVLEEILPARFGGGPTDYQLVEEESAAGQPRIRLLVSPDLGPLDSDLVADTFLTAISGGSRAEGIMGLVWRDAKLVSVERRTPISTASGKVLHLHATRGPSPGAA